MKKNNFIFALIFLSGCLSLKHGVQKLPHEEEKLRLSDDIVPTSYDLTLWTTETTGFSGQVVIDVDILKAVNSIPIHGQDLEVIFSDLSQGEELFHGKFVKVDEEGLARIDFDKKIPKGHYQLQLSYKGKYQEDLSGLYQVKHNNENYLFTQFEPIDARKMLPSFDEPKFKTPFFVKVVSQKGQKVIANSALKSTYVQGDQEIHVFEPTKPISTYLLALAVGPFDVVETEIPESQYRKEKIKLYGVATKGNKNLLNFALKETPAILAKLEEYFGQAYPFGKLHVISVPDFGPGAMENVGAITFRDRYLLIDENASAEQIRGFYIVMAHELAHQWFGNLVTMSWWNDLWLNEAFATWVSHKIVDQLRPEFRSAQYLLENSQSAMEQDSLKSTRKIREPILSNHDISNAFDGITYSKGGGVLSMLENYLSPDLFQKAVQNHLRKYSFGSATSQDFLKSLSLTDPSLVKSAESFLNQNGFPVISMSFSCSKKGFVVKASQSRFSPLGANLETRSWSIPMCIGYGSAQGMNKHCFTMKNTNFEQEIKSDQCPEYVLPNFNGQGYYRFSLDVIDWQNLLKDAGKMAEIDRMAIADSLVGELNRGKLDFEFVLDGLKRLVDINSSAMTGYFMNTYKEAFHYWINDEQKDHYQKMAFETINPIYQELKGKNLDQDQRILRKNAAIFMATVLKDPAVRKDLLPLGKDYIEKLIKGKKLPKVDSLAEDLLSQSLSIALEDEPQNLIKIKDKLKNITDTSTRFQILQAVASCQEGERASEVRSAVFNDLRKNEQMRLFYDHLRNPKNQPATFGFLENNLEKLKVLLPNNQFANTPRMAEGLCTDEDAQKVEQFFSPFIHNYQGGPRNLLEVVERIRACSAKRLFHGAQEKTVSAR